MLKLIGSILVVISCGILGMELGKNFARRTEELRQMQYAFQALETEIAYGATPLPQAMQMVAGQTNGPVSEVFLSTVAELAKGEGQTAGEAWEGALKLKEEKMLLNHSDLAILRQFGQGLGASDREDQMKRLKMLRMQLEGREQLAETDRQKFQKVWQSLGWSVGLVITMLFF